MLRCQTVTALRAFVLAALMASATLAFTSTPAQAKDELTIGVAQFPSSLHPAIDAEVIKGYVLSFVTRPVTAYDKDWKLTCLLCAELPTIENGLAKIKDKPGGGQGMAVTVKLKPDLKWGDGVPVTTKDLEFTWRVGRDPASGFINGHPWGTASRLDIVDPHTAILHLDSVNVHYNEWDQLLPAHLEAPVHDKAGNPADYIKQTTYNRAPTTAGLYNGPFLITQYQSGVQVVLEPNPNWPGPKPALRRIIIKVIENTAALSANLLSGDVDMVAGEGVGLTIDQAIALRKAHPDRFNYTFKPSLTYEHIDLQIGNPILADIRVRHALLQALDRQTLVNRLFEGLQPVAETWVNPLDPNYTKDVATYPYDLGKAKALLKEAGWTPGADGICRNAAGARLTLEFATTAGNRLRELTQQVLQSQWKAACVEVTLKNEPARTLFGETVKKRTYTGMTMYGWSDSVGASPRRTLHSMSIPTAENNYGGNNAIAFNNKRMDELIDAADRELDLAKQKAVWAEMQKIYAAELPVLPLFYRAEPHIFPKWLVGYTPTGHGDSGALWSENWKSN